MNEPSAICSAFESLCARGKPATLATVVSVSGSAYRRPGARMLIAEDGRTWGGISGGCLERDVVRRSCGVLASGRPVTCRYETTEDQDLTAGVATGCRGTVDLFIEPVSPEAPGPFPWLIQASRERRCLTLGTIVRTSAAADTGHPGTRFSPDETGPAAAPLPGPALRGFCRNAATSAAPGKLAKLIHYEAAGGATDVFLERLSPPQELVIFGGGPDTVPVVSIAKLVGWRVSVVGVRPATGLAQRFADADALHVGSSEDPMAGVELTRESAVVLMTHNYPRDIRILAALPVAPRYLGVLGPRVRARQLFSELADGNPVWEKAYAPIGLDLGAETPEEIALSIVAEIQAVLRSASGGFLRDRNGPIHSRSDRADRMEMHRSWREVACPA